MPGESLDPCMRLRRHEASGNRAPLWTHVEGQHLMEDWRQRLRRRHFDLLEPYNPIFTHKRAPGGLPERKSASRRQVPFPPPPRHANIFPTGKAKRP